jgi:Rad3-related DNA helicase
MKMVDISQWRKFFPFETPREEQIEAINFTLENFKTKKFVALDLGCGIGKSAIAITVARYLSDKRRLGAWYLTTQKLLQEQYMRDFGDVEIIHHRLKMLKSASNYTCMAFHCSENNQMSCAEISRLKKSHEFFKYMYEMCDNSCVYRKEKDEFITATHSLTNYAYFFAESQYAGEITPRQLLVCDECHTLDDALTKFVEVVISEKFAREKLSCKMPDDVDNIERALKWISGRYKKAISKKIEEVKDYLKINKAAGDANVIAAHVKQLELLDKHVCKVNRFIGEFSKDNWILNIDPAQGRSMRKLVFKPVDVSKFAQSKLFSYGDKVLLMSATILDKSSFCRSLGIDENAMTLLRLGSPFPTKNRPVHYVPAGSMSKRNIDATLPTLVSAIEVLLDEHAEQKGIAHCTNFRIAKHIFDNVQEKYKKRLLLHNSEDREKVLQHHIDIDEPTVLLSPSMTEGIDLSNDRSRFQIICKVPFPYLGDEVVQKRMKLSPTWYDCRTVRTIVQSLGRSIRSESDHATSYILDSDWYNFFNRTRDMFPPDFIKSIE